MHSRLPVSCNKLNKNCPIRMPEITSLLLLTQRKGKALRQYFRRPAEADTMASCVILV